jgi:hypothetical protein
MMLHKLCTSAQTKIHFKTYPNGASSITHLSLFLPGLSGTILSLSQTEPVLQDKQLSDPNSCYNLIKPVMTINNQRITKVYYRKVVRARRTCPSAPSTPIFGDHSADQREMFQSSKRKSTLLSISSLRRSKRRVALEDGFKVPSPMMTRSTPGKKKTTKVSPNLGKHRHFTLSDFPDLATIDKMMSLGLEYPEI